MEQYKLDRINELAHKVKDGGVLTEAELAERDALRKEYLAGWKADLAAQLEGITIQYPDGTKKKLQKKGE